MSVNFNILDTQVGDRVLNSKAISAIIGIGNQWFVNETTGSDTNPGNYTYPFATLDAALAAATASNGDTVYLQGSSYRTTTLAWNKTNVNLIGIEAPSDNCRSRIAVSASITAGQMAALTSLINVTAQGCSFINIATFYGTANSNTPPTGGTCWLESGGRNYYQNVEFLGMGDTTSSADSTASSITLVGPNGENLFVNCTFGLDTITRSAANATMILKSGTPRNIIRNGIFQMLTSSSGSLSISIPTDGIDRYLLLDNCTFINCTDTGSTTITEHISNGGGGSVIVQGGCYLGGPFASSSTHVYTNLPVSAATGGILTAST